MPKRKIEDIIVKRPNRPVKTKVVKEQNFKIHDYTKLPSFKERRFSRGKIIFAICAFLFLLVVGAKIIDIFAGAVIHIQPHQETVNINTTLKGLIAGSTTAETFDLSVQTMEIQLTEEKSLPATGTKTVEEKASGQIIIYNAFSSSPQSLIEQTRFETPDGKIYRIKDKAVVPGAKIEGGTVIPSSVEVTVYADEAGEEYNIGLTDFTIPGFKGGPRYDSFYARSKTPMTGGFKGEVPVVSDEAQQKLENDIDVSLENLLSQKAKTQTPEDFVLFPEAVEITFSQRQIYESEEGIFTMKKTGSLFAYLLNKKGLSQALIKKYLGEEFLNKVETQEMEKLEFQTVSKADNGIILFKMEGGAKFVWTIEEEELKKALIAAPEETKEVFKNYPAIEKASVTFKPSWWRFFPKKASKIRIESEI